MIRMGSPTHAVTDPTLIQFARRLSHDLNNYATVVRTYSELLLADLPPDSPSRDDVEEIQRAADGMVAYLQRVTRFSRASIMRRATLSVDDGLNDAVAAFAAQQPKRRVEVSERTGATINADAQWFRDAILELLLNAHDAAPADTPLRWVAVGTTETVTLALYDHGPGVPGELANLFEPFGTSRPGVRGAGQGLALVKAFALALGGDVSVAREGNETVFSMTLPITAPHP